MFTVKQDFTFSIVQQNTEHGFTGQLIMKARDLNSFGTVHNEEEFQRFTESLNSISNIPEFWTLETIAQLIYFQAKPLIPALHSLGLYLTNVPQRTVEYVGAESYQEAGVIEGEILEAEMVA